MLSPPFDSVGEIWEAMKNESGAPFSKPTAKSRSKKKKKKNRENTQLDLATDIQSNESAASFSKLTAKASTLKTRKKSQLDLEPDVQTNATEIETLEGEERINGATEAVVTLKGSILSWSQEEGPAAQALVLGDSDDDSDGDDGKENNDRGWRIDRFITAIQSVKVATRLEGLTALHMAVKELLSTLGEVPPLDFSPPYDETRIALTHRTMGGVVSDMSSEWAQWQRTHAPIMSQFRGEPNCDASASDAVPDKMIQGTDSVRARLQTILDGCGCALFRRYSDKSEKCRSLAVRTSQALCLAGVDMGKHIAYLVPAILARYPPAVFDPETQVFVHKVEDHEYHKRGGATERQDRDGIISKQSDIAIVEPSEEVRFALCELAASLVRGAVDCQSLGAFNAYFADIILALQSNLRDPYPKLKVRAAEVLVQLLRIPQWEVGAKYFALGLARAAIPNMRHRNSKVRIAAIELFEASVSVPNREKVTAAGSAAIADLVGFRDENVLPIAAFYDAKCGVTVNALAELVIDKNARVRERCCDMLSFFMVCLPDRYDHQVRLLPYVLALLRDSVPAVRQRAMDAVDSCGEQYEAEHPDEIIERRQYGIDGDSRCNHSDLPCPFESRPRLGSRLFVRSNSKRFIAALLRELTSWVSKTREQSAELLSVLIVYCEEHLTMDLHQTLPLVVKGLQLSRSEVEGGDKTCKSLEASLRNVLELMGRYIDPDSYISLLLPRALGDTKSATTFSEGGVHSASSRAANAAALAAMLGGSLVKMLLPHATTLIRNLSSEDALGQCVGRLTKIECLKALVVLLERVTGGAGTSSALLTAHYQATGRLTNLRDAVLTCQSSLQALIARKGAGSDMMLLAERGLAACKSSV